MSVRYLFSLPSPHLNNTLQVLFVIRLIVRLSHSSPRPISGSSRISSLPILLISFPSRILEDATFKNRKIARQWNCRLLIMNCTNKLESISSWCLALWTPRHWKSMLAKAVANHSTVAFIRIVGSEFVQKYLGEGPRMVRDVFRLAKENAPAIIFIDEVDAIATARFDAQTGAEREVQRILMELLNQYQGVSLP